MLPEFSDRIKDGNVNIYGLNARIWQRMFSFFLAGNNLLRLEFLRIRHPKSLVEGAFNGRTSTSSEACLASGLKLHLCYHDTGLLWKT